MNCLQLLLGAVGGLLRSGAGGAGGAGGALAGLFRSGSGGLGRGDRRLGGLNAGSGRRRAQALLSLSGGESELVGDVVIVGAELAVGIIGLLGEPVASARGGGTVSGRGRGLGVASERSGVLAGESDELVALAALWDLNTVLVKPLLELAVTPALDELIAERLLGLACGGGGGGILSGGTVGGDLSVAANGCYELVAIAGLRDWDTTLVEPGLEVRLRPLLPEPVAGVGGSLTGLVRDIGVLRASGVEERVAGAWRWVRDAVVVEEGLELRLSPAVMC